MIATEFLPPATKWGKVIFSQASVILLTGVRGLPQCMLGYHPPRSRHPPGADPPEQTPRTRPPWCRACWEIRSTHGRYASYWNAILFFNIIKSKGNFLVCTSGVLCSTEMTFYNQHLTNTSKLLLCRFF